MGGSPSPVGSGRSESGKRGRSGGRGSPPSWEQKRAVGGGGPIGTPWGNRAGGTRVLGGGGGNAAAAVHGAGQKAGETQEQKNSVGGEAVGEWKTAESPAFTRGFRGRRTKRGEKGKKAEAGRMGCSPLRGGGMRRNPGAPLAPAGRRRGREGVGVGPVGKWPAGLERPGGPGGPGERREGGNWAAPRKKGGRLLLGFFF